MSSAAPSPDLKLQSLNAAQINAHYAKLLSKGRVRGSGGLSPDTVHHVHAVLHRALRDAVKWGLESGPWPQ